MSLGKQVYLLYHPTHIVFSVVDLLQYICLLGDLPVKIPVFTATAPVLVKDPPFEAFVLLRHLNLEELFIGRVVNDFSTLCMP